MDLLTLFVIMFILFMVLLNYQSLKLRWSLGGISTAFFSTILAQIRFRNKIPSDEFVYFESFYFLIYAVIIIVLLVIVLDLNNASQNKWFKNNFITKLLYWPLYLVCIVLITIYYLY